ncbi:MAG TPA: hypothetical protein VF178_04695 [Gemmatimonadaceae bacterium]
MRSFGDSASRRSGIGAQPWGRGDRVGAARHRARGGHARCRRRQQGLALPAALIALVLIALVIAGSAFLTLHETRMASGGLAERRALEAAEYGVAAVLRDWMPQWSLTTSAGDTLPLRHHVLAGGAAARVRITRLTLTTFLVWSEGRAGGSATDRQARRVIGALLRLDASAAVPMAALTVRDSARIDGTALVSGMDTVTAPGGLCAAAPAPAPGVAAADTMLVCHGSCPGAGGTVSGIPPLAPDSLAADPLRYSAAVGGAWATLAARADILLLPNATITPAPVVAGGVCQRSAPDNWGDPTPGAACADWLPVIWAPGDVTITGGMGQGILLAAGDVHLEGGARFAGVVVAGDDLVTGGGGGTVIGAVLAGDATAAPGDHTTVGDGATVRWSACAVGRALFGSAPPVRLVERWWAELF